MKAVQVMLDERLLAELDRDPTVLESGRSAVIREAVASWLRAQRRRGTDDAYRRGYGDSSKVGEDWAGWEVEGVWPAD